MPISKFRLHNRLVFVMGTRPAVFYTFSLYPRKDENSCMDTLVFDDPLNDPVDAIRIVGSCNGLVCVALDPCGVILWNAAARKSKKLPISDSNKFGMEYEYGYDAFNDDYEVVERSWINRDRDVYETQVKFYSSTADSWGIMDWPGGKIFDGPGVFVNEAIHWKVYYEDNPRNWVVIAQDVTTETCSVVEIPVSVSDGAKEVVFVRRTTILLVLMFG